VKTTRAEERSNAVVDAKAVSVPSHKSNGPMKERKQNAKVVSEVLLVRSLNMKFPSPCRAVDTNRAFAKVSPATKTRLNTLVCL